MQCKSCDYRTMAAVESVMCSLSDPTEGHDPPFKKLSKEDSTLHVEGWGQGGPDGAELLRIKPLNVTVLSP